MAYDGVIMRVAGALALMCSVSCSWTFMDRTPYTRPPDRPLKCSERRSLPAVDAFWAVAFVATGIAVIVEPPSDGSPVAPAVLAGGVAALFAASGIWGYAQVSRCSRLKRYEQSGLAQPPAEEGGSCRVDSDCRRPLACVAGVCRSLAGGGEGP